MIKITEKYKSGDYNGTLKRAGTMTLWMFAALFSMAVNIALFDLMPCLVDRNPGRPEYSGFADTVKIIRIKKPEQQVHRKNKKRKIRPKEKIKKLTDKKRIFTDRRIERIDLPFEINPKLTAVSDTLKVSSLKMVRLDLPGLKGAYGIGEIDHPLIPIAQVPPVYPMRARRMGIEGWVRVKFIVDENGRVIDITIIKSRPEKVFNNSVLRCIANWRFTPGTVGGEPVKTWVETTVRFNLE